MVRGPCQDERPQRESQLRGHPDGRRSLESDGRKGDREGDRVRLRLLHTRGPCALLTPARTPRGGGRGAASVTSEHAWRCLSAPPALSLVCEWRQALTSLFLRDIVKLRAKVEGS